MSNSQEITVPDIGDFAEVDVIEILVSTGDEVNAEDPLITLESDKATVDVPAPFAGVIDEIKISVGDKVSEGSVIALLTPQDETSESDKDADQAGDTQQDEQAAPSASDDAPQDAAPGSDSSDPKAGRDESNKKDNDKAEAKASKGGSKRAQETSKSSDFADSKPTPPNTLPPPVERAGDALPHASPGVRRFARELGAELRLIRGSGAKGRITKEDVQAFVKTALANGGAPGGQGTTGHGIEPIPAVDFSQFGSVESVELSRIKRISGPHLHRVWVNVPHVTHHDEADVTDLEEFRGSLKAEAQAQGVKVTPLAFIMKALVAALRQHPEFNASLSPDGKSLILKSYFNIGIAVDTPGGLVVPVIRDVDQLGLFALSEALADVSERARDSKLKPADLQGGCMSISSLGGIGGTSFTPIINAPEVAILGVTRTQMRPVWDGSDFRPRKMLPLDLSYDHRVIDGAQAARFMVYLCGLLADIRRLTI